MYSIKVLEERKDKLDYAYSDLVKNGDVNPNSKVALLNRKRSKDIEKALSILNDSKSDDIMSPIISTERSAVAYCKRCNSELYEPQEGLKCPKCKRYNY